MKIESVTHLEGDIVFSELLITCRVGFDGAELPEPVWIREQTGKSVILWSPRGVDQPLSGPFLKIVDSNLANWELTVLLWKRYRSILPEEKGKILKYLEEEGGMERSTVLKRVAPELDIPCSEVWLESHRAILDLSRELIDKINSEDLSIRLIRYLDELPDTLTELITDYLLARRGFISVQQARKLVEAVNRISNQKIEELNEKIKDREFDSGDQLVALFEKAAYPRTSEQIDQFDSRLAELDLDGRIRVEYPENFEGDYLEFHFRCQRDQPYLPLIKDLESCRTLFDLV